MYEFVVVGCVDEFVVVFVILYGIVFVVDSVEDVVIV